MGQRHVTQTLENAIRLSRIGHGYIFSGQRGVGKTTVARLLAKSLNCGKGPIAEACGECDSCREIAAGRALDVMEIDAASNRGIDAVRELRENARYAPARDRYKVFIIDEAHQITPEGFNALLKTLEEPPPHVIFILATTEVHQFPETILSRCQHFNFHAVAFSEMLAHLEAVCAGEKIQAQPEALAALARSGEGSLRDSLSRLEQAIAAFGSNLEGPAVARLLGAVPSELLEDVLHAVLAQKRERLLEVVEKLVEEGYQLAYFCSQLVHTVRNLLVARVAGPQPRLLEATAEESQRLAAMAQNFTEENLTRFLEILLALNQQLRHSTQPRFHMELGLLKLVDAERLIPIEDLLAQMENRADAGAAARPKAAGDPRNVPGVEAPRRSAARRTKHPAPDQAAPSEGSGRLSPFERDVRRKKPVPESSAHAGTSPEEIRRKGRPCPQLLAGKLSFVKPRIALRLPPLPNESLSRQPVRPSRPRKRPGPKKSCGGWRIKRSRRWLPCWPGPADGNLGKRRFGLSWPRMDWLNSLRSKTGNYSTSSPRMSWDARSGLSWYRVRRVPPRRRRRKPPTCPRSAPGGTPA